MRTIFMINLKDIVTANMNLLTATLAVMLDQKRPQHNRFKKALELVEQIDNTREDLNPSLRFCGCFITQYDRTNEADQQGEVYLKGLETYLLFNTHIRRTLKMKPSTFARKPIVGYSSRCGAARDYRALVREYLNLCPSWTQSEEKEEREKRLRIRNRRDNRS